MIADGRPDLRSFVANHLNILGYYVASAQNFAEIGDDAGLEFCVRRLVENTKAVAASTRDILNENRTAEAEKSGEP
jgi:hypothetical protein